ncbi:MAG: hypothetical protein A4E53_01673 [Pelotomaculum sp. PtaB.Bin104]|jgi:hypothetical protein|nr:MAG: hypothetical protein A4E53_01673 [Pelotomaculum sp. PtaB.Bin104]
MNKYVFLFVLLLLAVTISADAYFCGSKFDDSQFINKIFMTDPFGDAATPINPALLLEDGDYFLLEDGGKLLLE